jgi:3-deoxy-D-manno-octulosonic-acid transferase
MDNIGMLSSAYRYAYISAIGGGFGKGIHNILEPACWAIPVMFGPGYKKFREAVELKAFGGAKSFVTYTEFELILTEWLSESDKYLASAKVAGDYVKQHIGATDIIIKEIYRKDINKLGS